MHPCWTPLKIDDGSVAAYNFDSGLDRTPMTSSSVVSIDPEWERTRLISPLTRVSLSLLGRLFCITKTSGEAKCKGCLYPRIQSFTVEVSKGLSADVHQEPHHDEGDGTPRFNNGRRIDSKVYTVRYYGHRRHACSLDGSKQARGGCVIVSKASLMAVAFHPSLSNAIATLAEV